jgi:hypothetical protein
MAMPQPDDGLEGLAPVKMRPPAGIMPTYASRAEQVSHGFFPLVLGLSRCRAPCPSTEDRAGLPRSRCERVGHQPPISTGKNRRHHHQRAMSSDEANAGAVAFVRKRPRLAAFADAVVLKAFGQVPEDFDVG